MDKSKNLFSDTVNKVKPVLEATCIKRPPALTLSQMTNFRLIQTQKICRQQFLM